MIATRSNSDNKATTGTKYSHREIDKSERVRDELKDATHTQQLMLGHCGLTVFPMQLMRIISSASISSGSEDILHRIRRLDLSYNSLEVVPDLSSMINLRELWLQNNRRLTKFPPNIHKLRNLEVIDVHNTSISEVPSTLAELDKLYELDWRGTPLAGELLEKHSVQFNDIVSLRELLIDQDVRKKLEEQLFEFLHSEQFLMDADNPGIQSMILSLVQDISSAFSDLLELKSFVRRASKLLPDRIESVVGSLSADVWSQKEQQAQTVQRARDLFYQFKRDTDRMRMAADVEIKLRGMYFDRIERSQVTEVLDSIYAHVASLEDIQFLVQYAPHVLPPEVKDASGERIWDNIVALQDELILKRQNSIASLSNAMSQLYPEQLSEAVRAKAAEVAAGLQVERFATKKELTLMSQLTADCAKVFPPDFVSIDCVGILLEAKATIFGPA